jgi:hypothetical protein
MGIDDLKARLERLLGEHVRPAGARERSHDLHAALVDLKVGLKDLRDALAATEREVGSEREHLETAQRRGRQAEAIGDQETAAIAAQFQARHRERVEVLDRKLAAQRDELAIAEREYAELAERYRSARQGLPDNGPAATAQPGSDDVRLRAEIDRQATEAAVRAQLEALKRKLGKQESGDRDRGSG